MAFNKDLVIKVTELVLALFCLLMDFASKYSENFDNKTAILVHGTFLGFTIILIVGLAERMMGSSYSYRADRIFTVLGALLFITAGCFIINFWINAMASDGKGFGHFKGATSIITGIIFLADLIVIRG